MKFYVYRIFNTTNQRYLLPDIYNLEDIPRVLRNLKTLFPQYLYEVHKIEIGKIDLVIENDD